jgi:hypothetical protein
LLPAAALAALVTRTQVLGHLFFQYLPDNGLDPFPDALAHLLLGQPLDNRQNTRRYRRGAA